MSKKKEFEIVSHSQMAQLAVFVVELSERGPHGHDDLEMGILLEGSVTLYLEQESFELKKGDIYLINRYQVHSFSAKGRNRILAFQINSDLCRMINPAYSNLVIESNLIHSGRLHRDLSEKLFACALVYFSEEAMKDLKCTALLLEGLHLLLSEGHYLLVSPQESVSQQNNTIRLNRITEYIAENYAGKLTLTELADREGLSPCHLSHFITAMLGMSFQDYLSQVRFSHALTLMNETDLNILDICLECGFSSSRYLNQMCQKSFGIGVKDYRRLQKKPPFQKVALPTDTRQFRYSFEQSRDYLASVCPDAPKISKGPWS